MDKSRSAELIGDERGTVLAFHRPATWEVAGVEIRGAMYHAVEVVEDRITRIDDYPQRADALSALGLRDG